MRQAFFYVVLASAAMLSIPAAALGQNPALVGSFRPYLFVLLAFASGWLLIGAWVFQIGRKVNNLARRIEEDSGD
jgi:hypothetical protein